MSTACFDFGNTRRKAAIFKEGMLIEEIYFSTDAADEIRNILSKYNVQKSILSSVTNDDSEIEKILSDKTIFHKLSVKSKFHFNIEVSAKQPPGNDRLALIAAAVTKFPESNTLVISLGTCITYNFVNQYRQFIGGAISPGMEMRFRSMHDYTAKLPLASFAEFLPATGYDTISNLQIGVVNGMIQEIEGIIRNYEGRYRNFNAVLTGGDLGHFAGQVKNKIFADSNFLFKGLYALSEINCVD